MISKLEPANWKAWSTPEDLPMSVRALIARGNLAPVLDPEQVSCIRNTVLMVFAEVIDTYLEETELRWQVTQLRRAMPTLPLEGAFKAVALEMGVTPSCVRNVWFQSRRKARTTDLVRRSLRGEVPA